MNDKWRPGNGPRGLGLVVLMGLLFFWFVDVLPVVAVENGASRESTATDSEAVPSGYAQLIPQAAQLKERLAQMNRQIAEISMPDVDAPEFSQLEFRLEALSKELTALKLAGGQNYERLVGFRRSVEVVEDTLATYRTPLVAGLEKIDGWRAQWQSDKKHWNQWRAASDGDVELPMVADAFVSAMQTIDSALFVATTQMKRMMTAQKRVYELQVGINALLIEVTPMIRSARGEFLQDFSPPMYAPAYYGQFEAWLFYDMLAGIKRLFAAPWEFFAHVVWIIGLQVLFSLALAVGIRHSGTILEGINALRFMRHNPGSVGALIGAAVFWQFYLPMPMLWELVLTAVILGTTARLVASIAVVRRRVLMMVLLAAVLLTTRLLIGIALPMPLFRLYILAIAFGIGLLCTFFALRPAGARRTRWTTVMWGTAALACLVIVILEVTGYSALSRHTLQASLVTIFIVILARLAMLLVRGLLESAFRSPAVQRIPFLPAYTSQVIDRMTKGLNLLVFLLLVGAVLQTWRVYTTSVEPIQSFLAFGVSIGANRITIGLILAAAACLYGSLLTSRLLQLFLMRDVFSKRKVDAGIGLSISRLLHYTIVLIGLMLALSTLGFELTNLTIIASALSVGIGFGLQTIVNNFVCGLILLFERPVKVGDIIQLGSQWATIRDIGLRATIIQTFDRSDIVVPNSDLITNQLINWTLDDRNMRIILTVGVAYGSDVPLVLETLKACTADNPRILNNPAPLIYFMEFGDSSLNFQIRVWIDDIDYMNEVRSELNQDIDSRFRDLGIEVPFPQRDLHLKTNVKCQIENSH